MSGMRENWADSNLYRNTVDVRGHIHMFWLDSEIILNSLSVAKDKMNFESVFMPRRFNCIHYNSFTWGVKIVNKTNGNTFCIELSLKYDKI